MTDYGCSEMCAVDYHVVDCMVPYARLVVDAGMADDVPAALRMIESARVSGRILRESMERVNDILATNGETVESLAARIRGEA